MWKRIENVYKICLNEITGCSIGFCGYKMKGWKEMKDKFMGNKGITLIALVVTIIVLLILARNINKYANRAEWNTKTS